MEKIEIELDKQTLEEAKLLAEARQCTLSELVAQVINRLGSSKVTKDPWMGLFVDQPELVDEIMEEAMKNRAN